MCVYVYSVKLKPRLKTYAPNRKSIQHALHPDNMALGEKANSKTNPATARTHTLSISLLTRLRSFTKLEMRTNAKCSQLQHEEKSDCFCFSRAVAGGGAIAERASMLAGSFVQCIS